MEMRPVEDDYARAGGYPIGVVSTLTGLPSDVIRVWERRYGLVHPARSTGGHRLYSPREVMLLRRAATLRAQGLTAAAACAQARAEVAPVEPPTVPDLPLAPHAADFSARLHGAALAMDAGRVSAVLAEAAAQLDLETLWSHVLAPALALLGKTGSAMQSRLDRSTCSAALCMGGFPASWRRCRACWARRRS